MPEAALRALEQVNIRISVLRKAKAMEGIYTWYSDGYYLWATEAEIHHMGRIVFVRRQEKGS